MTDAESSFLSEMIDHHEMAVKMSSEFLRSKGRSIEATALARGIIKAQLAEISKMKRMLGSVSATAMKP